MPLRSLRWIRPSAGASWAGADGATAVVAVAAAVVLMNTRRFISYGAVMTLPLELDDSRLVAASYPTSWTGASRQSSPPFARGLVIRASVRGIARSRKVRQGGPVVPPGYGPLPTRLPCEERRTIAPAGVLGSPGMRESPNSGR